MKKQEMIELLKTDVPEWNAWREENPEAKIDLSGADFRRANLVHANLRRAVLNCADLNCVDLSYADLRGAVLSYAERD